MKSLRFQYRAMIIEMLQSIVEGGATALDAARDAVAAALRSDRLVYVGGSGHSHLIAEEVFYRAGGIAAAQPITDPDLLLNAGAARSTALEREEGRAERVLRDYPVGAGDVVFVASNSGRNAYPIELALAASARGATTVAITSLAHASATSSRHRSGRLLHEVVDIVVDNAGVYGDAGLPIRGREIMMGPTSTITGVFIVNTVLAEAVAQLAAEGIDVDVYRSANAHSSEGEAATMVDRWRHRIRGL